MRSGEQIAALCALAVLLLAFALWIPLRFRSTPEKREKRRRLWVNQRGRLGDATITEVVENAIYYSYSISGVAYTASQDIRCLHEYLPDEPGRLIGPASMKYTPRNPANSIVLCEEWCGLRTARKPIAISR